MKIAFLSFEYPPETGFGGIGTYTWYQARALVKLGHEVHVLAGATSTTPVRTSEHDGVKVHRFRADGRLMRSFQRLDKRQMWWTKNRLENALSMYRCLKEVKKQHRFDVIEMPECGAEGLLINNLMRGTALIRFHSPAQLIMQYYDVSRDDLTCCAFLERLAIRGANALSACSQFLSEEVKSKLGIRRPIRVIPNGIDLELFDAEEQVSSHKRLGLPRDRLMILFSGRMETRKGIHLCREIACSILERFKVAFVFAGQDLFNYLAETLLPYLQARKLKGSVHYLGKLDLVDVRSCLRQTDIFLLPSLWENCPYSCLEAMAAGRSIVSTDQGGMPELIRHEENGLLARNGDPASYVACLEQLIEDSSLRAGLGTAARRTIEVRHTDVHIARLSVDHYLNCLNKRASGPHGANVGIGGSVM